MEGGSFAVMDMGSRNGTFLNHRRVTSPMILQPGDRILVGGHEFIFRGKSGRDSSSVPLIQETVLEIDQRTVTVLVADIRDFTGLASRLGDARLSEIISAFMREAGALLNQHGSWGQKYIGDAVMAIWVHPGSDPEAGELAGVFRALDAMFDIAAALHTRFGLETPIRIGAGINTGLASLGNMGSGAASDYTALSEAVNIAFRLESATKDLGCDLALGPSTYEALARAGKLDGLFQSHMVTLKGFREPKPAYAADREAVRSLLERAFA
jgi:adenylate cyclase